MGISCKEILYLPALKGLKVAGGANGLDRIIDWVYFGDVIDDLENGRQWINGNELVILTGISIKGSSSRLLKMLPEYASCNISGILISFGRYFTELSEEIRLEADRLALPIFTLPWEVKLVDASRSICNAIISREIADHESSNILNALLSGSLASHEHLEEILSRINFSLKHPYRAGVLESTYSGSSSASEDAYDYHAYQRKLLRCARSAFDHFFPSVLLSFEKNTLLFLTAEESCEKISAAIEKILQNMRTLYPDLSFHAGVGLPCHLPQKLPLSYKQAKEASYLTWLDSTISSPAFYNEADLYSLLLMIKDLDVLEKYHNHFLTPLFEYEKQKHLDLFRTLQCYYKHHFRLPETAKELLIHRNTLKYRLGKIEEILGLELKDPENIASIHAAIKIHMILKKKEKSNGDRV